MSETDSLEINTLKDDHNCVRNFKLGPIVFYAWIRRHYTT